MNYKVIPFVAAAMIMSGCGLTDENVTNASAEAKEKAKVTVKVVDYKTGLPVDSAKVYSVLKGDTMYTNASGIVSWKSNVIGDYDYVVAKDGYASSLAKVTVVETGMGNTARVPDYIVDVAMHEEGVTVNGTVLVKDAHSDNYSAAAKIPVVIRYVDGDVYPSEVETVTNSSGVFSFENLAEYANYEVVVPQAEIDGQTFEAVNGGVKVSGLRSGEVRNLAQISMEVVGLRPELISSNLNSVAEDEDVSLSFSTKLVGDSVPTAWSVYKNAYVEDGECYGGTAVLVAATLDKSGKTVVVNSVSNEWNRATYCVEGIAYTAEGYSASFARTFTPGALTERPSNVKISISEEELPTLWITWKSPSEDVSGYKIFYKTNKMADFIEFDDIRDSRAIEYSMSIYDSRFTDVATAYFVVLPYAVINNKVIMAELDNESVGDYAKKYKFE